MKKIVSTLACLVTMLSLLVPPAFAHVVVKPVEVKAAARQNFVVSVPTEEDIPTVGLRLVIPDGLKNVRPNVKPGWSIELKKSGEGENAKITEIIWTGGSIPAEQRDEFVFSAQAPAEETSLAWKVYQTYEDGRIVAWDQDPKTVEEYTKAHPPKEGEHDEHAPKPFSVTKVINDLGTDSQKTVASASDADIASKINLLMFLSGGALILSIAAMYLQMKKK